MANKAYACVRTDNMSGTTLGKNLVSIRYKADGVEAPIENGNLVVVGALMEGERELREGTTPAADSALRNIALIASEEVDKTKTRDTLSGFRNEAGADCRGYRLVAGDFFAVTKEAFDADAELTVGKTIFELQASTKMRAVDTATGGSTKVGALYAIEQEGATTWYVVEVA